MAVNYDRFRVFTALPGNIAPFGRTKEEVDLQHGAPDPNPVLSPMAAPRLPEKLLALGRGGSDHNRFGGPMAVSSDPYEGPRRTVSVLRGALHKLGGPVMDQLAALIGDPKQKASFDRIRGMMVPTMQTAADMERIDARRLANQHG